MPQFNLLSVRDVADIALQRTETLFRFPALGPLSYRSWTKGIEWPLLLEARLRRNAILSSAWADAVAEWGQLSPFLPKVSKPQICDIGCGHALIDLAAFQEKSDIQVTLVDIERNSQHYHHFADTGAGYASLESARRILEINGLENVETCNPTKTSLPSKSFDLMISIISAGFHYPVDEYLDYAFRHLKSGGVFIFDMRKDITQGKDMGQFREIVTVSDTKKSRRIACIR